MMTLTNPATNYLLKKCNKPLSVKQEKNTKFITRIQVELFNKSKVWEHSNTSDDQLRTQDVQLSRTVVVEVVKHKLINL
jgi:hypothetical protein